MHAVAAEAGVARPWPEAALEELRALPRDPLPDDPSRVDLRDLLTFTVDPVRARDFDDALSVVGSDASTVVYVHIADVGAFVPAGGEVDLEADERATSVYLPGRVDPMLPAALSDGLCSLIPGVDRYTLTIELGPGPAIEMYRSVSRSDHRLTYAETDALLAGGGDAPPALRAAVLTAGAAAGRLRERRMAAGALDLSTREIEVEIADGAVVDARVESDTPAQRLIEELMVRANEGVAELLAAARVPALFRVHEPPEASALEALVERLEALQVATPPVPDDLHTGPPSGRFAGAVSAAVDRRLKATGGRGTEALIGLLLRSLRQARYHPQNLGHSGLALAAYCHFTSPIRRYPDIVCHRALLAHLGISEPAPVDGLELAELADHTSAREREAAVLERRGSDICLAHLLDRQLYEAGWDSAFDGEVVGLIAGGMFVRFGDVFEGLLPARLLGSDRLVLDPLGVALVGQRTGRRVRLGDPVDVRVRSIDRLAGKVLLEPAAG